MSQQLIQRGKLTRGNYETLVHLMEQNHLKSHYDGSAESKRLEGMPAQKIFNASWRMLWHPAVAIRETVETERRSKSEAQDK